MQEGIDNQRAMEMVNLALQKMKREVEEIEKISLSRTGKRLLKQMRSALKRLRKGAAKFENTNKRDDFNSVCRELEALQPSFALNLNEIWYENGLDMLNETLEVMEEELAEAEEHGGSEEMEGIYLQLSALAQQYANSHELADYERALEEIDRLKPQFVLRYNELS